MLIPQKFVQILMNATLPFFLVTTTLIATIPLAALSVRVGLGTEETAVPVKVDLELPLN